MIELTADERDYLADTLKAAHTQLLHELHHATSGEFKKILRKRLDVNERLLAKIEAPVGSPVW